MHPLLAPLAIIFTAVMMFSASLVTPDREMRRVLDHRMLLARALLVNVVIVPVLAAALRRMFQLEGEIVTGAVLAAICPGAPFGTFLAGKSRQDVALAVVLTCGLTLIGLVTVPITSWLIFSPAETVALPRRFGLAFVTIVVLFPVALGCAIRRRFTDVADRIAKASALLTFLGLIAVTLAAAGLRSRGVRFIGWPGSALTSRSW